jgi:serine/threonine protein kinase
LQLLSRSGLVAPQLLEGFLQEVQPLPDTAAGLADRLVAQGVLTGFQAGQLLAGKWRGFFLGKYRILEPIASGGMGRVLLGEHTVLGRRVALKVLPVKEEPDVGALIRFHREGRAVASLDHTNIVRAYDMDCEGSLVYLALEYVEGESLADLVKRRGPLPVELAAECVRQAALGLQHAHDAGWVHRDIKPSNLLLTQAGVVKILDLGLARSMLEPDDSLTKIYDARHILGTLDYLSPEQVRQSSEVDGRSDIYSLGATFYFLLTARPPFESGLVAQKLFSHLIEDAEPVGSLRPDVPREVEEVVQRMLAKDPTQRYQEPAEVAEVLATSASAEPLPASGEGSRSEWQTSSVARHTNRTLAKALVQRRRHWLVLAAACLALALVTGTILSSAARWPARRSPTTAMELLSPQQASEKHGQRVLVELQVRSVGVNTSGTLFYLNSEENYRDRENCAIVIPREVVKDGEVTVTRLRATYLGRRVRVVGTVNRYRGRTLIVVENLAQVRLVLGLVAIRCSLLRRKRMSQVRTDLHRAADRSDQQAAQHRAGPGNGRGAAARHCRRHGHRTRTKPERG